MLAILVALTLQVAPVELVGPPAPRKYPILQYHGIVRWADEQPPRARFSDVLPVALAGLVDEATTEIGIRGPAGLGEGNPIPGLQSTGGRLAFLALEVVLLDQITRYHPFRSWRHRLIAANTVKHSAAALSNDTLIRDEELRAWMTEGSRRYWVSRGVIPY